MKSIQTSVLMSLLAAFALSCNSTTALQSSETDDMYYSSADKTVRQEMGTPPPANTTSDEATNPEYSDQSATSQSGSSVTNNYNYYDSNYSYASRSRTVRSPYRNWSYYDYGYYNDPYWYTPGAFVTPYYSAAYCYPGLYDPFWGPAYYPYSGITVSIGYGFGYGGGYYGYGHRPWGYNPYGGYYGGGYGYGNGYYQGFYEGYYAGNHSYYGVNRKVNYGPRGDRSNVPQSAPASATGRPVLSGGRQDVGGISPGRPMNPGGNKVDTNAPSGRPQRAVTNVNQAQPTAPGKVVEGRPSRNIVSEQSQGKTQTIRTEDQPISRPTQQVKPQNYEFQERPSQQVNSAPSNPRNTVNQPGNSSATPQQEQRPSREISMPQNQNRPVQEQTITPQERPVYQNQPGLSRPSRQQVIQEERPVQQMPQQQQQNRGLFGRPSRSEQQSAPVIRENRSQPSYQSESPSRNSNSNSSPSNSGGRPRR